MVKSGVGVKCGLESGEVMTCRGGWGGEVREVG